MITCENGKIVGYCPSCGTRMTTLREDEDGWEGVCPKCAAKAKDNEFVTVLKVSRSGKTVTFGVAP